MARALSGSVIWADVNNWQATRLTWGHAMAIADISSRGSGAGIGQWKGLTITKKNIELEAYSDHHQ